MELVLLVGANPRNIKHGPRVRLHEGKWKLRIEGQKDTKLKITAYIDNGELFSAPAVNGDILTYAEPATTQLELVNQGNEASISVFAELLS